MTVKIFTQQEAEDRIDLGAWFVGRTLHHPASLPSYHMYCKENGKMSRFKHIKQHRFIFDPVGDEIPNEPQYFLASKEAFDRNFKEFGLLACNLDQDSIIVIGHPVIGEVVWKDEIQGMIHGYRARTITSVDAKVAHMIMCLECATLEVRGKVDGY